MAAVFSAQATVDALCQFEAALALALADVGIAPPEEAEAVARACDPPLDRPEEILASTWEVGTPMTAVIDAIRGRLTSDAQRRWVHHGATTQDAVDSALMLQARHGLDILLHQMAGIARLMKGLVEAHRGQPQVGRTFLQHAGATTFGFRAATWLEPTLRHIQVLRDRRRGLTAQLGGPVGNLAAYGRAGADVVAAVAARLRLESPEITWHSDRSRVTSLAEPLGGASATMAKVAYDVALLAQSDIDEVRSRAGGSSSIPGKQNPIDSIRAVAADEVCRGAVWMLTSGGRHELDRGVGGWHLEWLAIPLLFQSAAAVMESTENCLSSLEVDSERMASRVTPGDIADLDPRPIDLVLSIFDEIVGQEQ